MKTRYSVLKYVLAVVFLATAGINVSAATKTVTYDLYGLCDRDYWSMRDQNEKVNINSVQNNPSGNTLTFSNLEATDYGKKKGNDFNGFKDVHSEEWNGSITFSDFKYRIKSITAVVNFYSTTTTKSTIYINSCKNTQSSYVVEGNSISKDNYVSLLTSEIDGISSITISDQNNHTHIHYLIIEYEEPTITVNKTLDKINAGSNVSTSEYVTVENAGAFTVSYTSNKSDVIKFETWNLGQAYAQNKIAKATLSVAIMNGDKKVKSATFSPSGGTQVVPAITVSNKLNSMRLKDGAVNVTYNYYSISPSNGCTVRYTSSDENYITVDNNGNVTPVAVGAATITVHVYVNGKELTSASLSPDGGTQVYELTGTSSWNDNTTLSEISEGHTTNGGVWLTYANIIPDNAPNNSDDWEFLGTLKSTAADYLYKVGWFKKEIALSAPVYSSVAYQFSTTSVGKAGSNTQYGSEILCAPSKAGNLTIQTNIDSESDYSMIKVYKSKSESPDGDSYTVKQASAPKTILDNHDGSKELNDQKYIFHMAAWTSGQGNGIAASYINAAFWYKRTPVTTYYATVNFYSADGKELLGSQDISAVGKTDRSHKLNTYTGTGKILGWKLRGTDGNVIAYTNGSPFNPYNSATGGGYGPVDLIAIMDNGGSSSGTTTTKTGNTVSIHVDNGTATGNRGSYYYWKHNQAPVQFVVSASADVDANTGLPTSTGIVPIEISEENDNNYVVKGSSESTIYMSVVMPRGYRILGYSLQSSSTDCTFKSKVTNYTYSASALNGGISETLSDNAHALYFELTDGNLSLDNFIITYTVEDKDNSYEVENMPSAGNSQISTDIMNLSSSSTERTAVQTPVMVYKPSTTIDASTGLGNGVTINSSGYYSVSDNADFIVEAPAGYRIVDASIDFTNDSNTPRDYNVYQTLSSINNGDADIVISDGLGHYLKVNGSTISSGDTEDDGARWTVENNMVKYNGKYLGNNNGTLALTTYDKALEYDSSMGTFVSGDYVLTYNYGWILASKYGPLKVYPGCFVEGAQYKLSVTSGGTNYYMVDPGKANLPYNGSEGQGWLPVTTNKNASGVIAWTYTGGHFVATLSDGNVYYLSGNIDWNDTNYNIIENYYNKTPILTWEVDENGKLYQNVNDVVHPGSLAGSWGGAQGAWGRRYLQYYDGNATVLYGIDYPPVEGTEDYNLYYSYAVDVSMSSGSGKPLDFPSIVFRQYQETRNGRPPYYAKAYTKTGYGLIATEPLEAMEDNVTSLSFEDGLNNDAVKFKVYGLTTYNNVKDNATFRVNLDLLPLDPQVQTVRVTASGAADYNKLTKSSDFKFNNGDNVVVVVPKTTTTTTYTLSLSDAANENDRSLDGASNFYLVGSPYYQVSLKTSANDIASFTRNATSTVGQNKIVGDNLQAFESFKSSANLIDFADATVTLGDVNTYYMYSADMPQYQISTTKHIAYRVYEMNVKVMKSDVDPIIKVVNVYEKTADKASNSTDYDEDTYHKYVGVVVGSKGKFSTLVESGSFYITNTDQDGNIVYMVRPSEFDQTIASTPDITDDNVAIWYVEKLEDNKIRISTQHNNLTYYVGRRSAAALKLMDEVDPEKIDWYIDSEGRIKWNNSILCYSGGKWQLNDGGTANGIEAISYSNATNGYFTSSDVITAITGKLAADATYTANDSILYVDMSGLASVTETSDATWSSVLASVADNALFFMPSDYAGGTLDHNVIFKNDDQYLAAANLVVKDKEPFFSPKEFKVSSPYTSTYRHVETGNNNWGTMCIPFDVSSNGTGVTFYNLVGSNTKQLVFSSYDSNDLIKANTPVVCHSDAAAGFTCTTSQTVTVAKDSVINNNVEYVKTVTVGTYDGSEIDETSENKWNIIGIRNYRFIYGSNADDNYTVPYGAETSDNVYCFSNNRLYKISPDYRAKIMPQRAYFEPASGNNAKSMSIIILDDEGFANDITDIISGVETVGDGKIYDLLGRRVKTPLKGNIYIVNGKKKIY